MHSVAPERLKTHVRKLSVDFRPRNFENVQNLDRVAEYIKRHFDAAGAETEFQPYTLKHDQDNVYRNVIGRFGKGNRKRFIIGGHYDAFDDLPGADDNASAVAGLIELAYLLGPAADSLNVDVELVAYTLEEPPFFSSSQMGSAVHAKSVAPEKDRIIGVIVFEMIGYFSDAPDSQSHPTPLLKLIYPSRGNFIAVVSNTESRPFTGEVKRRMQGATDLPVYSINAPPALPGIDFSDHASYWPHKIPAVMITDTAFYRNKAYHTENDTYDRLDYEKMAKVVLSIFEAIKGWEQ